MSAYKTIRTEFKSIASLKKALDDLGYAGHYIVATDPKNPTIKLIDYMGMYRPEKASIRIPREYVGNFSNDVGFAWDASTRTYQAIISEYDQKANRWDEDRINKLRQRYAYHEVRTQAKAQGYMVKETATSDGTILLQLTRR